MNPTVMRRFLFLSLLLELFFQTPSYCGSNQLLDALEQRKQVLAKENEDLISQKTSLIMQRLDFLKPKNVEAYGHVIESVYESGGYAEQGENAKLGIDGGTIQIDGFAQDRGNIADYMTAIEADHVGRVQLDTIKVEKLNDKNGFRYSIKVFIGAIGSNTKSAADKFLPLTPQIYVTDPSLFHPYSGPDLSDTSKAIAKEVGLNEDDVTIRRLGSVQLAKNLDVYVDEITFPANMSYSLTDTSNGNLIQGLDSVQFSASALKFTGTGVVYVTNMGCRAESTVKYVLQGKKLISVEQPLIYVGIDSRVAGNVRLFEDITGKKEVATLQSGTLVTVIGRDPHNSSNVVIKTPLGLTGWLLEFGKSGGNLIMDACN
jgi:hypothetical protein